MKERNVVISTVSIAIILAVIYFSLFNKSFKYHIDEMFTDSTYEGKIVFAFVNVNNYDKEKMMDFGKHILDKNINIGVVRLDIPVIAVVHFYIASDTMDLTDKLKNKIDKIYPKLRNSKSNLQFVKDGYIFTAVSKKVEGIDVPKDTLFKTEVILPKNGIKAQDIMKSKNENKNDVDSTRVKSNSLTNKNEVKK